MRRGSWGGVLNASNGTYLLVEGREYVETDCGVEREVWEVRWMSIRVGKKACCWPDVVGRSNKTISNTRWR